MSEIENIYQRIRERRAEIQRLLLSLQQEDSELAITERNVERFLPNAPQADGPQSLAAIASTVMANVAIAPKRGERKPKGIPTIFKMACDVLRDSAARGQPWLDTRNITEEIKRRWWPEAEPGFIQPQLWRAAEKRKALRKDGARYALPTWNEKGPAVEVARPFHQHGTAG